MERRLDGDLRFDDRHESNVPKPSQRLVGRAPHTVSVVLRGPTAMPRDPRRRGGGAAGASADGTEVPAALPQREPWDLPTPARCSRAERSPDAGVGANECGRPMPAWAPTN